jgi:DNA-binding CsgD family transcriptional regulator
LVQLTPRERQVLGFMGQGMTSKEIAKTLELSPRTIEDIRARMIKRHGVKRASELVARMMMRGK